MPLSPDEIRDRVDRYFAAWRALDPTAWTACFAHDAISHEPYGARRFKGMPRSRPSFTPSPARCRK